MEKVKISNGLLGLLLIATIFTSLEISVIVFSLLIIFGNMDESNKKIFVNVVAFLIGITLFGIFCNLIVEGVNILFKSILDFIDVINCYLSKPIIVNDLQKYVFTPITDVLKIFSNLVTYLITVVKFVFVISLLKNKDIHKSKLYNLVSRYVDKITKYFNKTENAK